MDIESAKRKEMQMRAMRMRFPQYYPQEVREDPFAFDKIVERYQVKTRVVEEAAEETGEGESSPEVREAPTPEKEKKPETE
jgi:hypothetical protein